MLAIDNISSSLRQGGKMYSEVELVVEITEAQADELFMVAQKDGLEAHAAWVDDLATVSFVSDSAQAHFRLDQLVEIVESVGARFKRVHLDLVGIREISEYAGVSRETARLWAEGKRKANFPAYYLGVGISKFWLWSEVAEWLRANGQTIDPDYDYRPLCGELKLVAA